MRTDHATEMLRERLAAGTPALAWLQQQRATLQQRPGNERGRIALYLSAELARHRRAQDPDAASTHGRYGTPVVVAQLLVEQMGWREGSVIDPACGTGTLLLAWCSAAADPARAARDAFGVDADADAVQITRLLLEIVAGAGVSLAENFQVADALGSAAWPGPDGAFDACIGNPPWVSHAGRHAVPPARARADDLRARFESYRGWPSLHGPFAERMMTSVASGGRVGMVLPHAMAEHEGFSAFRSVVTTHSTTASRALSALAETAFGDVTQPAMLLTLSRASTPQPGRPDRWQRGALTDPTLVHARQHLAGLPRPPAAAFCDIGVHTGNSARLLVRESGGPQCAPLLEGRQVHAGRLDPPHRSLDLSVAMAPAPDGHYFRVASRDAYGAVPIVLRQTARRPVAALHEPRGYYRNSVLGCRGIEGASDDATVAWLNSSAIAWWHLTATSDARQRAFPQVKVRHLRDLPLPAQGGAALLDVTCAGDQDEAVSRALGLRPEAHVAIVEAVAQLLTAPRDRSP